MTNSTTVTASFKYIKGPRVVYHTSSTVHHRDVITSLTRARIVSLSDTSMPMHMPLLRDSTIVLNVVQGSGMELSRSSMAANKLGGFRNRFIASFGAITFCTEMLRLTLVARMYLPNSSSNSLL